MLLVVAWLVAMGALALAQALVTRRLWRSDLYEREQKVAQTVLIWALPLLGAVVVYAALRQRDDVARLAPNSGKHGHESLYDGVLPGNHPSDGG